MADPLEDPPRDDSEVRAWLHSLGLDRMIDVHVHFLPERVLRKVWAYFDQASTHYGVDWPIRYRYEESRRLEVLDGFGVGTFAPLVYPHKPGMGEWLTSWALEFAERTPGAVPTATLYPEPGVKEYLGRALRAGARCVKAHVQVGAYDPRDELLDPVWGMLAESGVPVVVHCGHGPLPGRYTGLDVFAEVLRRHPRLVAVLAHAGMPEYEAALDLVRRYPQVHLDTTMVGVDFSERFAPLPEDWAARLAPVSERIVFGSDFPNIPYDYAEQLRAVAGWAASDERLGTAFLRSMLRDAPARLLGLNGATARAG